MDTISEIKEIDIKKLIEQETDLTFSNNNMLSECPFCGSGTGANKSPAFSINVKKNYYKCFSCGSQGTTIDFIMNLNNGWKERHAIKYLEENYLDIIPSPPLKINFTDIQQKTIYAIGKNPLKKLQITFEAEKSK